MCHIKMELIRSIVIYITTAREQHGSSSMEQDSGENVSAQAEGDDSFMTVMFESELLFSYPELLLQAQPVVRRPRVVKPLQMALQRAHIQLCVSIQIVLQQSLVDEGVLHLRGRKRGGGESKDGGSRTSIFMCRCFFLLPSHHR